MQVFWIFFLVLTSFYLAMILIFILGVKRMNSSTEENTSSIVPLSIIVPMRNEQENLQSLLDSLLNQDFPIESFEVILVDDHSTDMGLETAAKWQKKFTNLKTHSLPDGMLGKKNALAMGIAKAAYHVVVLTDVDCIHPVSWLSSISQRFSQYDLSILVGPVMLSPVKSVFEMMQALEHASLTASTIGACAMGFPIMASSANLSFSKEKIGFNSQMLNLSQSSGDDVFLLHKVKQKQLGRIRCMHSTNSLVQTNPAKSFGDFLVQRARWASKATSYKDIASVLVGIIVFLFNALLLLAAVLSFFMPLAFIFLIIGFGIKCVVDFYLLYIFLRLYNKTKLLKVFLPLQLLYPFYVVITFAISQLGIVGWKGRRLKL